MACTVLVADDDRAIRESLTRALELEGYRVAGDREPPLGTCGSIRPPGAWGGPPRADPHLEGPVVTVTAAALAGAGVLPWWSVWLAAASAHVLADTLLYAPGRHGDRGRPRRLLARLGLTDERRDR